MRAGRYNKKIDIHNYHTTRSTISGELKSTWTTSASNIWANVEYTRGDESFLGSMGKRLEQTNRVFTVRFSSFTSAIGPDDRIVFKSKNYDIKAVENVNEENVDIKILGELIE